MQKVRYQNTVLTLFYPEYLGSIYYPGGGQCGPPYVTSKIYDLQIRNFAQTFTNYREIKNDKKNQEDVIRNLMTS